MRTGHSLGAGLVSFFSTHPLLLHQWASPGTLCFLDKLESKPSCNSAFYNVGTAGSPAREGDSHTQHERAGKHISHMETGGHGGDAYFRKAIRQPAGFKTQKKLETRRNKENMQK